MLSSIIEQISIIGLQLVEKGGYLGVFLVSFLENVFTPIPSEAIIPFAGVLVSQGKFSFLTVVLAATLGSILGAYVFYYLGYVMGSERFKAFIIKWGKYIFITENDVNRAEDWFKKYGMWAVLFCRVIPIVRSFISIPAGYVRLPFWKFTFLTAIGTFVWSSILITVGFVLGENYESILPIFKQFERIIVIIFVLLAVFLAYRKITAARNK